MKELINKSCAASMLISLGVYGLLNTNYSYLSMVLFAFGLFVICYKNLNLFTGKCGFIFDDKNYYKTITEAIEILIFNLISGYIIGIIFSYTNPKIQEAAASAISNWSISFGYFIKSFMCGVIMYLAVLLYKSGTPLGIFLGIPLFILCGFQHSIANVIIMGAARDLNLALILCIIGNWSGSLSIWYLTKKSN